MKGANSISIILTTALFFASVFATSKKNITCGANEEVDECPRDCSTEYCPTSAISSPCPYPDKNNCPPAKCVCVFDYRRAENGTCIPTADCPPFECNQNEVYNACPNLCPTDSCADAPLHGVCPFPILIRIPCSPTCQCQEGFCRQNGTCIPYEDNGSAKRRFGFNIFF